MLIAFTFYSSVFFMAIPTFSCHRNYNESIEYLNNCSMWNNYKKYRKESEFYCEFKDEYYNLTAVNDWDLVCDKKTFAKFKKNTHFF